MSIEYSIRFEDHGWYVHNRNRLEEQIKGLPSYLERESPADQFWLKESGRGSWAYDVRVIPSTERLLVEVSAFGEAFHRDIEALLHWINQHTRAELVDDDGLPLRGR
jgi:hypothetical protein